MLSQIARFLSFLLLSSISLHNLFINSSIDVHLGCFYTLAVVSHSVINIRVHISFLISVFIFIG